MATLVAIGGGIIGSIFGMPQLGFLVGSLLGSLIFKQPVGGPKLSDLKVTASTYGSPIHWGWGVVRVGGNIIWCSQLIQHNEGNGKGSLGGPSSYQYTWTGALGISQTDQTGPIVDILRIWADTKLVFDKTGATLGTHNLYGEPPGSGKGGGHNANTGSWYNNVGTFRILHGTETQMPDAAMEALFGAENCNANRGQSFVVFDNINLINYGNRVPNFSFEVAYANSSSQNQLGQAIQWNVADTTVGTVGSDLAVLDAGRQRAYFFCHSTNPGIKVVDLTTRQEIAWWPTSIVQLNSVGVVGSDGFLYYTSGTQDLNPLYQIDPDSFTTGGPAVFGQYGTGGSFIGGTGIPNCTSMASATVNGLSYLAVFASGSITPKACMLFNGLIPLANSSGEFHDAIIQSSGSIGLSNTQAAAYVFGTPNYGSGPSSSAINLYQIPASTGLGVPPNPGDPFYQPGVFFSPIATISPSQIDPAWTEFNGVVGPIIDQTDGNLIAFFQSPNSGGGVQSQYYIAKINSGSGAVMWTTFTCTPGSSSGTMEMIPFNLIAYQCQIVNGTMAWEDTVGASGGSSGRHIVFLVETQAGGMTFQTWPDLAEEGGEIWADSVGSILFYGDIENIMTNQWGVLVADLAASEAIPVATIVGDICEGVGYTLSTDIDTTDIADLTTEGYVVDQQMSGADGIKPLALAFTFDATESDGKIKFIQRGHAPIATVPSNDLAYMDKKLNSLVNEVRAQEVDLPNQISINFIDPTRDFEASTQYFRRPANPYPTMFSKNPRTENIPIVAQPTFIKQLCEKLLYMQWIERVSYKTKLPWKYLQYDPTDVLTLTLSDSSEVVTRTLGINVGADFSMEMQSVSENAATFSPNSTAFGGHLLPQYLIMPSTSTKMFLLDVPLLRDQDDTGESYTILYYALGSYSSNWAGANIMQSPSGGNFQNVGQTILQGMAWGSVRNALPAPVRPFGTDYANSITVNMVQGSADLTSCTYLEMMNGANGAVLFNPNTGVVEVIQFMTVVTNADGSQTLSGLLRGRRGTDTMMGSHTSGEYLIFLGSPITTATGIGTVRMTLTNFNQQEFYEAVGIGQVQASATPVAFTDTMRTLLPYAPEHVQVATSGVGDLALTWMRRTRVNGNLHDWSGTVPLNETTEKYSVDIYDPTGMNVLRTLNVAYGATPSEWQGLGTATPAPSFNHANGASGTSVSSFTASLSSGGAQQAVIMLISNVNSSSETVSSISAAGLTFTRRNMAAQTIGGNVLTVEEWWAPAPTTLSSLTATVTFSGTVAGYSASWGAIGGLVDYTHPFVTDATMPSVATDSTSAATSVTFSVTDTQSLLLYMLGSEGQNENLGGSMTTTAGLTWTNSLGPNSGNFPAETSAFVVSAPSGPQSGTTVTFTQSLGAPNSVAWVDALRIADFGYNPYPGLIYPNAEVVADFGSIPSTLTLEVFQISGALNVRGFGSKVTVIVNGPPSP